MKNNKQRVKILDCTIRDGGYLNNWKFEKKFVREIYRSLAKAGIDYFEIGYRSSEKFFNEDEFGLWRFSSEQDIRDVCNGICGPKIAVMVDYGKFNLSSIISKQESPVSLVRLAAHKNEILKALDILKAIKDLGYETSIQAMGFPSYSARERNSFLRNLNKVSVDYVYIADSYGSILPHQIKDMLEPFFSLKNRPKIGFHPHNSLQMAFANSLEAIKYGVDIIDSSLYGMGRGAGNLSTEIMLAYLQSRMPDKFNIIPVLEIINDSFVRMQREIGWGYQLPYMLSGIFQCHPTYIQKLINFKEFTMDDICRTLECIKRKSPSGFSEDLLNTIISQGVVGRSPRYNVKIQKHRNNVNSRGRLSPVPYINRHKGRTFLILGNGPSLKQYRMKIQKFIDKHDPIVMGPNYLGGLFIPHYHAFSNKKRFIKYIDSVRFDSKILISQHVPLDMIREYTWSDYEKIYYLDTTDNDFSIIDGVIQCSCRTVSVLLMAVAIVMGADKIFAAGLDGYLNIDKYGDLLFYHEQDEKEDKEIILSMHRWNNKFLGQINSYLINQGREGIHILTPTSYNSFYKGIKNYI